MQRKKTRILLCNLTAAGLLGLAAQAYCGAGFFKPKPQFEAQPIHQPDGGAEKGLVQVSLKDANGAIKTDPIMDIPTGVKDMTPVQRAQKVADRMTAATNVDSDWIQKMSVGKKNGEYVIQVPTAPGGYVLTCDAPLASHSDMGPEQYANAVISYIQRATGYKKRRMGRGPLKDAVIERRRTAYQALLMGDNLYEQRKTQDALQQFKQAALNAPDYVEAQEQLTALYKKSGNVADADAIAQNLTALRQAETLRKQGDIEYEAKNWDVAAAYYAKASDAAPFCLSFYLLTADAYQEAGKKTDAIHTLRKAAARLYPDGRIVDTPGQDAPGWGLDAIKMSIDHLSAPEPVSAP